MEINPIPLIFFILSIVLLVIRVYTGNKKHFLLSAFLILLGSGTAYFFAPSPIQLLFLIAIISSLVGDLLMARVIRLSENRTVDGAIFFGVAHITYIAAFSKLKGSSMEWWIILISLLLAVIVFYVIGYDNKIKTSVLAANLAYAILISILLGASVSFVITPGVPISLIIVSLLGVGLFMLSDGILAYNEFKKPIKNAKVLIAITYILAQIALQSVPILISYIF